MKVELLNTSVTVYARVILDPDAESVRDRFCQVSLHIESSGMVGFGLGRYRFPEDREQYDREREVVDLLIDEGIVEWKAIGPEDSELFLTAEGEQHFAPQMRVLGGWHEWPETSPVVAAPKPQHTAVHLP